MTTNKIMTINKKALDFIRGFLQLLAERIFAHHLILTEDNSEF